MSKKSRLLEFPLSLIFGPGLYLWSLVVRTSMYLTTSSPRISLQGRLLTLALRGYRHWSSLQPASVFQVRKSQEALARRLATAPGVRFELSAFGGRPAEWAIPAGAPEDRAVLYFHGGGYTTGSIVTHRGLVSQLAASSGIRILSLDYRLAPENPHPAAFEDAFAAYRWLLGEGFSPGHIALAGDSAGGGLATALLAAIRDGQRVGNRALPAGAVLLSPWLDISDSKGSWEKLARTDWLLTPESLQEDAQKYLGCPEEACIDLDSPVLRDPYVSPRFADLHGLPPLLVHVGGDELLRDDIRAFVTKAHASGVQVSLSEWPGMFHDWHLVASYLPEGRTALNEAGAFLKMLLA